MPEVSVIIPSYGVPDRLWHTVQSVLRQTFQDLEVIVVDDNNPDTDARHQTEKVMSKLVETDARVRYLKHPNNINGSAARNTGIRAAKGQYISLLDSDDEYLPDRLMKCIKVLKETDNPKVQGVYTGCEYRKNNQLYRVMTEAKSGNFLIDYLKLEFNLYTGSNIFITKSAADTIGGFDESFIRHQDVEFMIRFFEKYDIVGIAEPLVIKNFDAKNKPSAQKTEEIKKHFFTVFKPLIDSLDTREREQIFSAHRRQLAEQYIMEKNYRKALELYLTIRESHCLSLKYLTRAVGFFIRSIRQ